MSNIERNDYIGWLAKLLLDPRRGSGFIATEFVRRLPQPGCAVGIVDSSTISFTASGSGLDMQLVSACFDDAAGKLSEAPQVFERDGAAVLAFPLPQTDSIHRKGLLLAAKSDNREALETNKVVVEQVTAVMQQALSDPAGTVPCAGEGEAMDDLEGE